MALETVSSLGTVVTALIGLWIVWLGHRLARRQRADSWLENLESLHEIFWEEPDFKLVREWIVLPTEYEQLCETIALRFTSADEMTSEQYRPLETLDRFFNFLIRVQVTDSQVELERHFWEKKRNLGKDLFFNYWLREIVKRRRWHILLYIDEHYAGHTRLGMLIRDLITDEVRAKIQALRETLEPSSSEEGDQ